MTEAGILSLGQTTPILRIFDEVRAKEFYVEFLGFKVDWELRRAWPSALHASLERRVRPASVRAPW